MVQSFRPGYLPLEIPLESKTMVSKTLLLELLKKKMNKVSFYLRYKILEGKSLSISGCGYNSSSRYSKDWLRSS